VRKISLPPGLDPRTAQPIASRYTDYAAIPHSLPDWSKFGIRDLRAMLLSAYDFLENRLIEGRIFLWA
jgi:hypothetical protein